MGCGASTSPTPAMPDVRYDASNLATRIGSGASCDVFLGTLLPSGEQVAVKLLDKLTTNPKRRAVLAEDIEGARTEAALLKQVRRRQARRDSFPPPPAPVLGSRLWDRCRTLSVSGLQLAGELGSTSEKGLPSAAKMGFRSPTSLGCAHPVRGWILSSAPRADGTSQACWQSCVSAW